MNTIKKLFPVLYLLPMLMLSQTAMAGDDDIKVIEMDGTNQLQFTVTEIVARPGQTVKVILTTVSDFPKIAMAHNFVLLKAKADAAAVAAASARASDNEYIAPEMEDQILAYTGMAGGGETVEVTFTVPETPGTYEYICTFPGHYAGGMKGTLVVKKQAA
ncbi:MAG: plastocyanin/azurin family copper-binding protein [Balneolaceae bacterium]|nr:plastocyanin/azurin family copper-binding protein [Balneolaceae bacterium]